MKTSVSMAEAALLNQPTEAEKLHQTFLTQQQRALSSTRTLFDQANETTASLQQLAGLSERHRAALGMYERMDRWYSAPSYMSSLVGLAAPQAKMFSGVERMLLQSQLIQEASPFSALQRTVNAHQMSLDAALRGQEAVLSNTLQNHSFASQMLGAYQPFHTRIEHLASWPSIVKRDGLAAGSIDFIAASVRQRTSDAHASDRESCAAVLESFAASDKKRVQLPEEMPCERCGRWIPKPSREKLALQQSWQESSTFILFVCQTCSLPSTAEEVPPKVLSAYSLLRRPLLDGLDGGSEGDGVARGALCLVRPSAYLPKGRK